MPTILFVKNYKHLATLLRTLHGNRLQYPLEVEDISAPAYLLGYLLAISLCAFAGTCESPIENKQETDEFPGTPTNLPTHFFCFALDSML